MFEGMLSLVLKSHSQQMHIRASRKTKQNKTPFAIHSMCLLQGRKSQRKSPQVARILTRIVNPLTSRHSINCIHKLNLKTAKIIIKRKYLWRQCKRKSSKEPPIPSSIPEVCGPECLAAFQPQKLQHRCVRAQQHLGSPRLGFLKDR